MKNPATDESEIYIAFRNAVVKLEYHFGEQVRLVTPEQKSNWNEVIIQRNKFYAKIIRESKTMAPGLPDFLEILKTMKKSENDLSSISRRKYSKELIFLIDGPILFKQMFSNKNISGIKSLENDFLRYSSKEKLPIKKSSLWILDALLADLYEKKTTGESLISGRKGEKKFDAGAISLNLAKTLKK